VWHNILNLVRSSGIPYSFGNSYRDGDPLWHGGGRAIDFSGYNQDRLAQFFWNMRPRVLELIHSTNSRNYGISRGQPDGMNAQLWAEHEDHLHIAMDDGGRLEPGWTPPIWNGTGKTEAVLTNEQWSAVYAAARGGDGASAGAVNYNIQFADTTLTPGRFRAMQDRQDALARPGRAR
jgi:hypothetical protein